jgi:hypothetical protein
MPPRKTLIALMLIAPGICAADAENVGEELKSAFGDAYYLKNVPDQGRHYCGKHVWTGYSLMSIDVAATVYDVESGELVGLCGGNTLSRDRPWYAICGSLFKELESCPFPRNKPNSTVERYAPRPSP